MAFVNVFANGKIPISTNLQGENYRLPFLFLPRCHLTISMVVYNSWATTTKETLHPIILLGEEKPESVWLITILIMRGSIIPLYTPSQQLLRSNKRKHLLLHATKIVVFPTHMEPWDVSHPPGAAFVQKRLEFFAAKLCKKLRNLLIRKVQFLLGLLENSWRYVHPA